jgi:hypothetical protein
MSDRGRDRIEALREVIKAAHEFLEGTTGDLTEEVAHWTPPGTALPIAAFFAHVVIAEDGIINGLLKGGRPLYAGPWSGRTGMEPLPPPRGDAAGEGLPGWTHWARSVRVDLPALRRYAKAVFENTDDFLSALADADLSRPVDLGDLGLGMKTFEFLLARVVAAHPFIHGGEISCLKGLQGQKGMPF